MIHTLTADRWIPIAYRDHVECRWLWARGFTDHETRMAHAADDIIVMHRGDEMVARLAGPCWRRLRVQMRAGRA